jgi:DNA polymerase III subunit epsilon
MRERIFSIFVLLFKEEFLMGDKILFIDTETGGLNPIQHSLLSLALVVWQDMKIMDSIEILINDGKLNATEEALKINKIDLSVHKKNSLKPERAINKIQTFIEKNFPSKEKITLAGHNVNFDVNFLRFFLQENKEDFSKYFSHRFVDTSSILYYLYLSKKIKYKALSSNDAFQLFGIKVNDRHTALGDALATAELFTDLIHILKKSKLTKFSLDDQLNLFEEELNK